MTVTSLRYQLVEGGALGGHFALHVTLGGSDAAGATFAPDELAQRIHGAFEELAIKCPIKGVLFDCRNARLDSTEMSSLLALLHDWGLTVILWVGPKIRYPWFERANHIVVFVTAPKWPNFRVSEIRYVLPKDGKWTEPEVYEGNKDATCFVVPTTDEDTNRALAFVLGCTRLWGVVLPTTRQPIVNFKLKD